jgi:hypothetical protein
MATKKPRKGYKISYGHEVPEGMRWSEKLGKAVKEKRGKQPGGVTARSKAVSFGISQIDEKSLTSARSGLKDADGEPIPQSALLYQFFQEGMAKLAKGTLDAKAPAPARPVVVLLSMNHLDDLELAQQAWKLGAAVIVPALNTAQLRFGGIADKTFDAATLSFVRTSDAVLFGKGLAKSKLAPQVKAQAKTHGKPVLSTLAQMSKWMDHAA